MLIEWERDGTGVDGYVRSAWWYKIDLGCILYVWEESSGWTEIHQGSLDECKQVAEMYEATGARSD